MESNNLKPEENNLKPLNLKLRGGLKSDFKRLTRKQSTTMQTVLAAFVETYVESPEKFRLKVEIVEP